MRAMDRWFSRSVSDEELALRYREALRLLASDQFTQVSDINNAMLTSDGARDALNHFNEDWINVADQTKGGRWWPQYPTSKIIAAFRTGMIAASFKGLGWTSLDIDEERERLFLPELRAGLTVQDLTPVLPRATCWACPSPPGSGTFLVDALRSGTVVQVVILTPGPLVDQAERVRATDTERLQDLEKENARLKRILVDKELALDELREGDRQGH
jgi:hypothetical protein